VQNPISLKETDAFPEIIVEAGDGGQVASYYDATLTIQMDDPLQIADFSFSQSNSIPGKEATYTIRFSVEAGLPPSTAMRIETPKSVDVVRTNS
jgi:hypothetical protein